MSGRQGYKPTLPQLVVAEIDLSSRGSDHSLALLSVGGADERMAGDSPRTERKARSNARLRVAGGGQVARFQAQRPQSLSVVSGAVKRHPPYPPLSEALP